MLQVCPNGPHDRRHHPHVPITVADVVASVETSLEAGASEVHVHPKDGGGRDSLDPVHVDPLVEALRARCGAVPVGVTTGIWAVTDHRQRMQYVEQWGSHPDYASVNWHEPGAAELADLLLDKGIGVEAGLWYQDAAESFRDTRGRANARGF
ncbi:3-keto-5-aminohexanoate cleavage protein [Mycolicibacterium tusciae]|uniref:3-keto-5-aminohexanoate cleavage protein n=1 Tax=Mycolicibacterium tusciae TaxID=75922 RepID=UPI0009F5D12A|nr:3-keto-5-aminohexanoate cleavage protein [Mycolicibacterium tusciae]